MKRGDGIKRRVRRERERERESEEERISCCNT